MSFDWKDEDKNRGAVSLVPGLGDRTLVKALNCLFFNQLSISRI